MSYHPHAAPTPWQHSARQPNARTIAHEPQFDYVRITRLGVLMALVAFWIAVIMAIF